jgi:hypothetical protein
MEAQGRSRAVGGHKSAINWRKANRERKLALLQDVLKIFLNKTIQFCLLQ